MMKKSMTGLVAVLFMLCVVTVAHAALTDGLVAFYPLSGNANDASGNGHNGTVYGGSSITADRFNNAGTAYVFDSRDDYIDLAGR